MLNSSRVFVVTKCISIYIDPDKVLLVITKTRLIKYIENFQNLKLSDKNSDRLWVFVRTASASTHNLCFEAEKNKKNNVYPCKPKFYYIKGGSKGGQNNTGMFS